MFGINEILKKAMNHEELTEEEKFKILNSKRVNSQVIRYLMHRLSKLYIEVLGDYQGSLFELMRAGKLVGWCWQTTESAIVFLDDSDIILRGYLKLDERTPRYYHSWISFTFKENEYVFDPCFDLLCKKEDYYKIFEVEVKGRVTAKEVKEELIRQLISPKQEIEDDFLKKLQIFLENTLGECERQKNEVVVSAPEDVNTPLYRNGAGYKAEIENNQIKKLTVHYYYG